MGARMKRICGYGLVIWGVATTVSASGPEYELELIDAVRQGDIVAVEALAEGATFDVVLFRTTAMTPAAFESAFQTYVERRFGPWAMLTSPDALWLAASILIIFSFVAVRFRNRARVAAWEREDPLEALPLRLRLRVRRAFRDRGSKDSEGEP